MIMLKMTRDRHFFCYNTVMKPVLLLAAFILEMDAFAGFSTLPYIFEIDAFIKILLTLVLLIVLIAFWSTYMSPKASRKLGLVAHYFSKFVIYSVASITLLNLFGSTVGVTFIVAAAVDEALLCRHNAKKLVERHN